MVKTARFLDRVRSNRARLGDRPRPCDVARRAARVALGLSDFAASAFRVPIEFLRPIPSAALIPLAVPHTRDDAEERDLPRHVRCLLAAPRPDDVRRPRRRPVTIDTARSFGVPRPHDSQDHAPERGAIHPDRSADRVVGRADPRVHGRVFMGTAGLGARAQLRAAYGLTTQLYALALATGILGLATHLAFVAGRASRAALASLAADWRPL